jgi:hypothetical protein
MVGGLALVLASAASSEASFHFMQIEQVIGGVNGDSSAQAIQLRMRANGQNLLNTGVPNGPAKLVSYDAAGLNPVTLISFGSNVSNSTAGSRVLITTSNFANYTSPALTSDFTMGQSIAASRLAAGRLTFENNLGVVYWSLAWGGGGYTGSTTGAVDNDSNGDYGKLAFALPGSGLNAVLFTGAASALSTTNSADYALSDPATFINNAGTQFTVVPEPATAMLIVLGAGIAALRRRHASNC